MDLETFVIAVFCLVDDFILDLCRDRRPRQRGPISVLADSEVLTLEIVGEFLGLDTDQALHAYFRPACRAGVNAAFPGSGATAETTPRCSNGCPLTSRRRHEQVRLTNRAVRFGRVEYHLSQMNGFTPLRDAALLDQPEQVPELAALQRQVEEMRRRIEQLEREARETAEDVLHLRDQVAGGQRDQQDLRTARARLTRLELRGLVKRVLNRK